VSYQRDQTHGPTSACPDGGLTGESTNATKHTGPPSACPTEPDCELPTRPNTRAPPSASEVPDCGYQATEHTGPRRALSDGG